MKRDNEHVIDDMHEWTYQSPKTIRSGVQRLVISRPHFIWHCWFHIYGIWLHTLQLRRNGVVNQHRIDCALWTNTGSPEKSPFCSFCKTFQITTTSLKLKVHHLSARFGPDDFQVLIYTQKIELSYLSLRFGFGSLSWPCESVSVQQFLNVAAHVDLCLTSQFTYQVSDADRSIRLSS